MAAAVEREKPDAVIHLGDHLGDAEDLSFAYQDPDFYYVPGNCDYAPTVPQMLTLEFDGVRIFATHGHLFGVKRELTALADAARERGAQLALFGHTHVQCLETIGGVTLLNPGAAGRFDRSGYGVVTISGGTFECRLETDTE